MSRGLFDQGIAAGHFDGKVRGRHLGIRQSKARFLTDFVVANQLSSNFFHFL